MRTHVAKMFVGTPVADGGAGVLVDGSVAVVAWGEVPAILEAGPGATIPAAAASDQFGFVAQTKEGTVLHSGPFSSINSIIEHNPYVAGVQKKSTLTVDVTNAEDGKAYIIKVVYHDNLSIIPNQMKFTTISVVFTAGMTATQFAAAIAAEFNKQDQIFVSVTSAVAVVTFTALVLTTASDYNRIDRPEWVNFELAVGDMTYGSYVTGMFVVDENTGTATIMPQGTAAQTAWMEDNHQGRRGYSDRRMWNDTKRYKLQTDPIETYATIIVTDNKNVEGDMQNIRHNPIGAVIAEANGLAVGSVLATTLGVIIAPALVNTIEHPVDS